MRAPLLLVAFSLAFADAAPSPIPVTLTIYATPRERDFGSAPAERIRWKSPLDGRFHWSLFVPGFADRDSSDPRLPDIAGAAMEGSGEIEPAYHRSDRALSAAMAAGYRFLILDQWKARRRLAVFSSAGRSG
ncbi:MAG: hypothetical protein KGL74_03135 [Elusimicrobia bacterium]|nr:hypothetical protein [Elusimicrobiota bacterium]